MLSHATRGLVPHQKNRRWIAHRVILSASLLLLLNQSMIVKAGGRATPSFSVFAQSTQQPDSPQRTGKYTQAISVFELGESTELLLSACQIVGQPIPAWQATQAGVG